MVSVICKSRKGTKEFPQRARCNLTHHSEQKQLKLNMKWLSSFSSSGEEGARPFQAEGCPPRAASSGRAIPCKSGVYLPASTREPLRPQTEATARTQDKSSFGGDSAKQVKLCSHSGSGRLLPDRPLLVLVRVLFLAHPHRARPAWTCSNPPLKARWSKRCFLVVDVVLHHVVVLRLRVKSWRQSACDGWRPGPFPPRCTVLVRPLRSQLGASVLLGLLLVKRL